MSGGWVTGGGGLRRRRDAPRRRARSATLAPDHSRDGNGVDDEMAATVRAAPEAVVSAVGLAKVYGQASVGAPPMSVPHLDTRYEHGRRALLFGPSTDAEGLINLFGALRRAMAKTGYSDLKEFQRVGLIVRG